MRWLQLRIYASMLQQRVVLKGIHAQTLGFQACEQARLKVESLRAEVEQHRALLEDERRRTRAVQAVCKNSLGSTSPMPDSTTPVLPMSSPTAARNATRKSPAASASPSVSQRSSR